MKSSQTLLAKAIAVTVAILTLITNETIAFTENHHADISPPPPSYINTQPHPPPMYLYTPAVKVVGKVYCYRCYDLQNPTQSHDKQQLQDATVKVTCNAHDKEIIEYGQTKSNGKYSITILDFPYWLYGSTCKVELHGAPIGSDCTVPIPGLTEWDELNSYTVTTDEVVFKAKELAFAPKVPYECNKLPHGEVPPLFHKSPPPPIMHVPQVPKYKSPPPAYVPVPHVPTYQYRSPPLPVIPTPQAPVHHSQSPPPLPVLVPQVPPYQHESPPPALVSAPKVPNHYFRSSPPPSLSVPPLPSHHDSSQPSPSTVPQIPTYQYNSPPPRSKLVPIAPTYQYKSPPPPLLSPLPLITPLTPQVPIYHSPPPPASLPMPQIPTYTNNPPTPQSVPVPQVPTYPNNPPPPLSVRTPKISTYSYNPPLPPFVPIPQVPNYPQKFPPPLTAMLLPPLVNNKYPPPQNLPTYIKSPPPAPLLPTISSPLPINSYTSPLSPSKLSPPPSS
ncbi:hypothetical protein LUZ63_003488 [Rhynchospora breviuscula]|uniref:Uncharacterized protein n=1 Tax=Rhynchospora breviuscula TaxID=2022672 RepID=A0A9Q0HYT1_9POAL|nr:hypothetical protein LUZ63_003488 [Rhynchospora breviuscula]